MLMPLAVLRVDGLTLDATQDPSLIKISCLERRLYAQN